MPTDPSSEREVEGFPDNIANQLHDLNIEQLKHAIDYAQNLISEREISAADVIDENDEDIIYVEERLEHTVVVRKDEPRNTLFHVTRESRPDGSEELNWRYIGFID